MFVVPGSFVPYNDTVTLLTYKRLRNLNLAMDVFCFRGHEDKSIVKELVRGKLVTGVSGKGGGYQLCRPAADYSVGEILELLEGPLSSVACLLEDAAECPRADSCQTLPMWSEFDHMVHDFFYGKKLTDLIESK